LSSRFYVRGFKKTLNSEPRTSNRLSAADGQANDRAFFPAGPAVRPIRKRKAE
jgi:hypothetical protein